MEEQFLVIPPTLHRLRISRRLLRDTRDLLAASGEQGFEAVVLWLGRILSAEEGRVELAYFPRQVAYHTEDGLAVEIPVEEWTELALRLPPSVFVLAKVHSHAEDAYHSPTDDANPYLCHEGAFSIVVPRFAREPLDNLARCSANMLQEGRWGELSAAEVRQAFIIEEGGQ